MKRILIALFVLATVISISNSVSAQIVKKKPRGGSQSPDSSTSAQYNEQALKSILQDQPKSVSMDSMFISLERTPCFGHCPAYKFEIFYRGYVQYHGYNYVDHVGDFYTAISRDKLRQLFDNAKEIKLFNMKDTYINPAISDFPTTIVTMVVKGQKKTIIDGHYETPSELIFFEKMIDDMFKDAQWKSLNSRK